MLLNFIAVRAKRPECTFRGNFKLPLLELEKLTRSSSNGGGVGKKGNLIPKTKTQRLKSAVKAFARFLFFIVLMALLAAVVAKLYVTYRNRRLVSLSDEGYVPK